MVTCVRFSTVWKFLPSHVCLFSETCLDKRSFPSNQIKVLVSVLLKNTSNTLLTYCYLWKPQRWKKSQLFFAMVNSYIIVYCAITCYTLGVKFSPGIKYNYNNVKYIMINGIILYSEFLIPDLRSNFRLLEFLGTDLQPFLIWVDLFQLFRCGLHSRVNQNVSV